MNDFACYASFADSIVAWLKAHSLKVAIILLGAWALSLFSNMAIRRIASLAKSQRCCDEAAAAEQEKRVKTIGSLLSRILNAAIITLAVMMVLAEIGVNIAALLASAGVIGLALGFGAQSIVKDAIAGLFLIMEDQFRLGDIVELNGGAFAGVVEKMTLRTTWLRGEDGRQIIVPNGGIASVTNFSRK